MVKDDQRKKRKKSITHAFSATVKTNSLKKVISIDESIKDSHQIAFNRVKSMGNGDVTVTEVDDNQNRFQEDDPSFFGPMGGVEPFSERDHLNTK